MYALILFISMAAGTNQAVGGSTTVHGFDSYQMCLDALKRANDTLGRDLKYGLCVRVKQ